MGKENELKNENIAEKKSIIPRTAVKGLINGFIAYGILIFFIFFIFKALITWYINNNINLFNYDVLKFTLPTIFAIVIFYLIRFICRLSTYDLFKNCKIEKNEISKVVSKMNLFYIGLSLFFVVLIIVYMLTIFNNEKMQIERDLMIYKNSNSIYADEKEEELIREFEINKSNTIIQTVIIEMGLLLGVFSLTTTQKKFIERYN